jgi:hypothetical protein
MVNNIQKYTPVSVLFTLNFTASPLAKIHITGRLQTGFHAGSLSALFRSYRPLLNLLLPVKPDKLFMMPVPGTRIRSLHFFAGAIHRRSSTCQRPVNVFLS